MKSKKIKLGTKTYPVICTLNVLEEIQESFPTIQEFERELLGLYFVRDEDGQIVYKEDGSPKFGMKEPSIKAIRIALVSMINEGLKVDAYEKNKVYEPVDEVRIMQECDVRYSELASFLHDVYAESMSTKKL